MISAILNIAGLIIWIFVGIYFFVKIRKIFKKMDLALDEFRASLDTVIQEDVDGQ